MDDFNRAIELIKKADDIFVSIKERDNSKTIYEEVLELEIKDNCIKNYVKGKIALIENEPELALTFFNRVTKTNSKFTKGWNYLGVTYDILKDYNNAIKCYDKAIKLDPNFALAWNNKGIANDNLGNHGEDPDLHKEAIDCYNKVIKIKSPIKDLTASAWNNKGVAFDHLKDYKRSINCYNRSLEMNPEYYRAYNYKGIAYCNLGKYNEAIKCYNDGIGVNSSYYWFKINKGRAYHFMGRYGEAIDCFEDVITKNPDDVSIIKAAEINKILSNLYLGNVDETEIKTLFSKRIQELGEKSIKNKKLRKLELEAHQEVMIELKDKYKPILEKKDYDEQNLQNYLNPREIPLEDDFLIILRRWNSYTPAMRTDIEVNNGGGYFLYWKGRGIVIDPGFDFLQNFLHKNEFRIYDIDAVIITHAHIDHCVDFEAILTLIYEYNNALEQEKELLDSFYIKDKIELENKELEIEKFNKELDDKKKKIDVFLNLGSLKKFLSWLPVDENNKNAKINRIYPLEKGIIYDFPEYNIKLKVTEAIHNEILVKNYSTGLIIDLYGKGSKGKSFKLGFTSDTSPTDRILDQYKDVDIIIPHLGSIEEDDFNPFITNEESNHLKLKGIISAISKSNAKLAIISEFGEELGDSRLKLVRALDTAFQKVTKKKIRCLTGDIGLKIKIPEIHIKCNYCPNYISRQDIIEEIDIDPDINAQKGITYFCDKCKRS